MNESNPMPLSGFDEEVSLRTILQGTSAQTGEDFFRALVQSVGDVLNVQGAMVTEYLEEKRHLRTLAFRLDGQWIERYEFDIKGTPCEVAIRSTGLVHFPDRLLELFPSDQDVTLPGLVSYMGMPLLDLDQTVLGHLAVIDRRPMPAEPRGQTIFQIFAARAAAELQRLRAETAVRQREEKLARLVGSAMDAIIELDDALRITHANAAAEQVFQARLNELAGRSLTQFIADDDRDKLNSLVRDLSNRPEGARHLWIPGGLTARRADGHEFPAEATLAAFQIRRDTYYTIILRNVNDRLEAERRIQTLTREAEVLRQEIRQLHKFDEILGSSKLIQGVLRDVQQVAPTHASVLIFGETGTGKELIARAIHSASSRRKHPLIKVNCAAIPATLIESEFFGHEKGAFTGATQRREGRFALADGGTIFLDELGELPLDLQTKLLRVLQEGEFEPVGSSKTRKVDVRVVAATNRDLAAAVRDGEFREDLFYRLNVFPIALPPLRERSEDIAILAEAFIQRFVEDIGTVRPILTEACIRRLTQYHWPGNVRELQNVIERAMITSRNGQLDLDRALPMIAVAQPAVDLGHNVAPPEANRIRTIQEMAEEERQNIALALQQASWRVSGAQGAAQLLGMKPSTLHSRMKALGIERPR